MESSIDMWQTFARLLFSSLIAIGFLAFALWAKEPVMIYALGGIAILFGLYAFVAVIESSIDSFQRIVDGVHSLVADIMYLGKEGWNVLGFKFPELNLTVFEGEVREMFEHTRATKEQYLYFLQTSSIEFTSPRRDWNTTEHPREIHIEIITWLIKNNFVYEDSAAGNRSWRWRGNSYERQCKHWFAKKNLPNLNDIEGPNAYFVSSETLQEYDNET